MPNLAGRVFDRLLNKSQKASDGRNGCSLRVSQFKRIIASSCSASKLPTSQQSKQKDDSCASHIAASRSAVNEKGDSLHCPVNGGNFHCDMLPSEIGHNLAVMGIQKLTAGEYTQVDLIQKHQVLKPPSVCFFLSALTGNLEIFLFRSEKVAVVDLGWQGLDVRVTEWNWQDCLPCCNCLQPSFKKSLSASKLN